MPSENISASGGQFQQIDTSAAIPIVGGMSHPTLQAIADVLESAAGVKKTSGTQASSPELMQALYLLWFSGGNQPVSLQQLGTGNDVTAIGGTQSKPINAELFILQEQNKLNEICIGVLNAWAKSIHEENVALKKKEESDIHKQWEERHGKAGFNAWVNTLSPEQRHQVEDFPRIEKLGSIDKGTMQGLRDYLTMIKTSTDPKVSQDLPFVAAATVIGGPLKYEYSGVVDTVSTSLILIQPIKEGNDVILNKVLPQDQAATLGYIGALFLTGASYQALGNVLPVAGHADKAMTEQKFAQNYAQSILKALNGSAFNSIAMAMISSSIDPNHPITSERQVELVNTVKVSLISTAMALLYKTDTGGLSAKEFLSLAKGSNQFLDSQIKADLAALLRNLNPSDSLLATIGAFFEANKNDTRAMTNVPSLLANLTLDLGSTNPAVAPI